MRNLINLKIAFHAILVVLILQVVSSCTQDQALLEPKKGSLSFNINSTEGSINGRMQEDAIPTAIFITIKDAQGNLVYNLEKLNLVKINGAYITSAVELETGEYTVEDFIVAGADDASIYITPKTGSKFENLVSTPLPYEFKVYTDEVTTVVMDVIPSSYGSAGDFGYAEFTFNVVDLEDGLVAHFPFSGTANDESGNGLHGSIFGAVLTADRHGNIDSAFYFDGVNDRIEVDNNALLENQAYSVSAWFKAENGTGAIVSMSDFSPVENNCGYYLSVFGGKLRGLSNVSITTWAGEADDEDIILNEWHHAVFTYNGENLELFLNGTLVSSLAIPHTVSYSEHNPLQIGTYFTQSGSTAFLGAIDEVRIYNRVLNESEIKALARE